jgi:hypothetical protein
MEEGALERRIANAPFELKGDDAMRAVDSSATRRNAPSRADKPFASDGQQ